jgi:hypothetical protein
MDTFSQILLAAFFTFIALKPGPLEIRAAKSRGPWHTFASRNARIIRAIALVFATLIWIDLWLRWTGRAPLLH